MKPYLAILIDSFWEAVTSKILWGLLICWTILLGGLAPFGYVTEVGYQLSRGDIINPLGLAQKLAKGLSAGASDRQQAISSRLSESFKKDLKEINTKTETSQRNEALSKFGRRELSNELNKLIKDPDLFDPTVFDTVAKLEAVKSIVEKDKAQRNELDVQFLNRQILRMTYSADLRAPRNEQIWFGYAGIKIGNQLPFERSQINMFIEGIALQLIIRFGLSFVVVFVGLIITSSMIPETFRSGALHLLLSKPVSRPLVYLTKFAGGTLFVLINIAYLLTGLFFLVGWRLGIWNAGLLYCIPLLLFVFVIFYSVSALVGLIWNNPIICVVVCIVFWIFCLTVGALEGGMRMPAVWLPQIVRFTPVGDDLMAITQSGDVNVWNEKFKVWQPAADLPDSGPGRIVGPIVDLDRQRVVLRADFFNGMGDFETRSRNLVYVDLKQPNENAKDSTTEKKAAEEDDSSIPKDVEEARRKPHWNNESGVEPPMLMIDLVQMHDKTLAVTRNGIFEIDWKVLDSTAAAKSAPGIFGDLGGLFSRIQPQSFKDLQPADYVFGDSVRVTKTPDEDSLILFTSSRLDNLKLDPTSGKFVVASSLEIDEEKRETALLAASNGFIVVGREDQALTIADRQLSQPLKRVALPNGVDPRQIQPLGSTDRFSIVTHDNRLLILDAAKGSLTAASVPSQGAITGVTWISDTQAWIGVQPSTAMLWDIETGKIEKTLAPTPSRLDIFYNYIARPLYVVSPKPSSLNGVLQKLLQRERAGQTQLFNNDISAFRVEIEVWQPIISNLIFVMVLLGIGCLYVWRKEF